MPPDPEDKIQLKDNINTVLCVLDQKIMALAKQAYFSDWRTQKASEILSILDVLIQQVKQQFDSHVSFTSHVLQSLLRELESRMIGLGLDEDQEHLIIGLVNNALMKLYDSFDSGIDISVPMQAIKADVQQLLAQP